MVCRRASERFSKNLLRVFYTQFRRLKCRAFFALSICLASVVIVVLLGCIMNCLRETPMDPTIDSPLVRTASWLNRKGLSVTDTEVNNERVDVALLVLIHASGNSIGRKRRDVIRRTWVSDMVLDDIVMNFGSRVVYKFVLGAEGKLSVSLKRILRESKQYNDMIILDDVSDEHETLTKRTLFSFTHIVERGYQYEYVLKCDDDTFVDLRAVMSQIVNKSEGPLHWGSFVGGYKILNEGPYAENAWYICDKYLPYAFGGGYMLSRDLIELLASNAPFLKQYNNEDVSVAAWLAPYNLQRTHDLKFDTQSDSHGCMHPFIVAHKISIAKMKEYFISLQTEGIICGSRTRTHSLALLSHFYNWTVLPVHECCSYRRTKQLSEDQQYV